MHMNKRSTWLIIREMQMRTTRYPLTPIRMAVNNNNKTKQNKKQQALVRTWRNWDPPTLLVGM